MTFKEVSYNDLYNFHLTLWLPEDETKTISLLAYNDTDEPIGFVCILGSSIEVVEVFEYYQNNGYGKELVEYAKEYILNKYDYVTLDPIENWLIPFYENLGFHSTLKYKDNLSEFPTMKYEL
jgi:hypothetical protein